MWRLRRIIIIVAKRHPVLISQFSYLNSFIQEQEARYDNQSRLPSSVHRPSHRMTSKVLTHGSRFTVHGQRRDETHKAKLTASSQQLEAGSNLAPDN